jgi:hypothetical protein
MEILELGRFLKGAVFSIILKCRIKVILQGSKKIILY